MSSWDRVGAAGTIAVFFRSLMGGSQTPPIITVQVFHKGSTKVTSSGTLNNGVTPGLPVPHGKKPWKMAGPPPPKLPSGATLQPVLMALMSGGYCSFV